MTPRLSILLFVVLGLGPFVRPVPAAETGFDARFRRLASRLCLDCHDEEGSLETGLELARFTSEQSLRADNEALEAILERVESGSMPPAKADQPTGDQRRQIVAYLETLLLEVRGAEPGDPGIVVMPRLNHAEYDRVVAQLTGRPIEASRYLPKDPQAGEGFLNVGAEQAVTAGQIEKYLDAANFVLKHAVITPQRGLRWHDAPVGSLGTPAQYRTLLVNEWVAAMREADTGLVGYWSRARQVDWRNADILVALWKYRHSSGDGERELFDARLVPQPPHGDPIPSIVLSNWWEMLTSNEIDAERFRTWRARFFADWYALPSPNEIDESRVRKIVDRMLAPLSRMEESRPSGRQQEEQVDFFGKRAWKRGSDVYFTITTGGRPRKNALAIVTRTELRFDKTGDLGDRWRKHWPEFVSLDGRRFEWGKGRDGIEIEPHEAIVELPVTFEVPVPEGCWAIRADAKLDDRLSPDTWAQPFFSSAPPTAEERLYKPGESLLGVGDDFEYLDRLNTIRAYYGVPGKKYRFHQPYLAFHEFEAIPLRYLDAAQWPNCRTEEGRVLSTADESVLGGSPLRPRILTARQIRENSPTATRERFDTLEQDLRWAAQPPLQDLRKLAVRNGNESAVEGDVPTEADVAEWSPEDRQEHERLVGELESFESDLGRPARRIVQGFAERAWRRDVEPTELDRLMTAYRAERHIGGSFDAAVKQALKAVMLSPDFLFRPSSLAGATGPESTPLSDLAVATRLAFTLWGAGPDEELLQLARERRLTEPGELRRQTRRMLADEKSKTLATDFAGQWLGFADFDGHTRPNPERFPEYDQALREALYAEVVTFVHNLIAHDRPLTNLIDADYTFANERLAEFYGIPGVDGDALRRVEIPESLRGRRGGLFGMGAVLTRTSTALRTSPVLRGAWLYKTVLGNPMPEPPPDVEMISADETDDAGRTIAEQLAQHRASAVCASCHDRLDPPGIALEGFDPIGRWRDSYLAGNDVIDRAELADGESITGPAGLRTYLLERREKFLRQFARKFLGYALGRELLITDKPLVTEMVETLKANDYRPGAMVETVVLSRPFLYRRDASLVQHSE